MTKFIALAFDLQYRLDCNKDKLTENCVINLLLMLFFNFSLENYLFWLLILIFGLLPLCSFKVFKIVEN